MQTRSPTTVLINAASITVKPRETVLQAALRSGMPFPSGCGVGSCATCKCRLVGGTVRQLTETSYLLSDEELDRGTILACQSVPTSNDVRIEVELAAAAGKVGGRVVAREELTHDIARLRVKLERPLAYEPGQFANLTLVSLPDRSRSYSFATPPDEAGEVAFVVRRVPGGRFSSHVVDGDVVGEAIELDGPHGEFRLRPSDAPLLMIAGGSGLSPILAMLRQAALAGVERPVTLLFGAREERDLFALAEIEAIAAAWKGDFRFVPVLSGGDVPASFQGRRGLVGSLAAELATADTHAYLCGPPAMIDHAVPLLEARGVRREYLHCDRFTPQGAPEPAAPRPAANALHYLKFFLFHLVGLFALSSLVAGRSYVTAGLLAVLAFYIVGDALAGDDTTTPRYAHPRILTMQLWLALPLLGAIVFAAVWSVSAGDPLSFGHWVEGWTGYDALAARNATPFGHHVSGWVLTGLMIGLMGTIPGHELTHHTWDPVSLLLGRWLLAFSFDTSFAIEHVYGHHRYVSTTEDPATAPRGRNVYTHILVSTFRGNVSGWKIEKRRLARRGFALFSVRNAVLRGYLMSVTLVALAWTIGGPVAAGFFVACALWGKALLEIVNYMEHYGLVRDPRTPVQPRHSWNTNKRLSSWTMFNLTRHSHHHAQGEIAYHDLAPYPDAPMMLGGYLTTLVVAMIPPLWHTLMVPKVLAWDRDHATATERVLATRANARSRLDALACSRAA